MSRRGGGQQPEQYHASPSARRGGDGGGRGRGRDRGRGRGRGGGGEGQGRGGGRGGPGPVPATTSFPPQTSHTTYQAVSRPTVQTPSSSASQPAAATTSRPPSAPQAATTLPPSPHQAMIQDIEKKLTLTEVGASSSKALVPPTRPGFGTVGRKIMVKANHFAVKISDKDLYHYDVSITPEVTSKKVNRDVISALVKLYRETHLGRRMPAYDGRKSLYTAGPLPFETREFVVKLADSDNPAGSSTSSRREREFKVAIKFATRVDTYHLQQFLSGRQRDAPQDIIQILDIVLRAIPSTQYVVVGRSFFSPKLGQPGDLGDGIEYWRGYYQSLRPTQMGLSFNIDVSARGFYEPILVTDFVAKYFNFRDLSRPLSDQNRLKVKKALKGIKVRVSYRDYTKTFKITGISSGPVSQTMFLLDDKKTRMSVLQYFRERYNIALKYPSIPALQAGSDAKLIYLPMELCSIVEGQRYTKRLNEKQVNNLLIATCERPLDRERNIQQMVSKCNFSGSELVNSEFGIEVSNACTLVEARVLPPPMLKYHDSGREVRVDPQWGQWNMINKKMVNGGVVDCWTCVNFSNQVRRELPDAFCRQLIEMCRSKGMVFSQNPILPIYSADSRQIERTLNDIHNQSTQILSNQGGKQLQLLIIILPDIKGSYGKIKRICETELGIVSQCCQPKQAVKLSKQYLENVALKINVKVGGRNTVLNDAILRRIPLVTDVPTIIFGADVTHPPPGEDSNPSIAAVVASMDWPEVTKYRGIVSAQAHREEIIQDLYNMHEDSKRGLVHEGMIRELLLAFRRATQQKPYRIIFYRDGVSEGQFSQVLLHEIDAIRRACASLERGYQPRITFVVVQKRHHTRFFPADHGRRDQMDRSGNILPGTVVEKQICHPTEFDFYLNSHAGIKGTSRPSHYHVLFDENGFSADALQTLTNSLCYTYARCTRSVSLVPPAYYAHLAAFRARYYIERETSDAGSTGDRSATGSTVEVVSLPIIKENVKNVMFYC